MVSLMQFVGIPAALFAPILAGRRPSQRGLLAAAALLSGAGILGLLIPGGAGGAATVLWVSLLGLGQGASISLALTLFALRTADAKEAASLSGMAQSVGYLLAATGPFLFGVLHDLTRSWSLPLALLFAVAVGMLLVGVAAGRNAHVTPERQPS